MTRGHKGGPPRGPGHYSEDGRRWWDDDHRCWFPVTDQEDQLEIEVEDYAETSLFNRLWSGLFTQYGHPMYFRFVGHARSADPRWPTYQVVGATFPEPGLGDPQRQGTMGRRATSQPGGATPATAQGGVAVGRAGRALVVAALQEAGGGPDRRRAGRGRGDGCPLTVLTMGALAPTALPPSRPANEARVTLEEPRPSPELLPSPPGRSQVILTGRAIPVPFRSRRLRFATVNHGHS
jgi:hypothetical protein